MILNPSRGFSACQIRLEDPKIADPSTHIPALFDFSADLSPSRAVDVFGTRKRLEQNTAGFAFDLQDAPSIACLAYRRPGHRVGYVDGKASPSAKETHSRLLLILDV